MQNYNYKTDIIIRLADARDVIYIRDLVKTVPTTNKIEKSLKFSLSDCKTVVDYLRDRKNNILIAEVSGTGQIVGVLTYNYDKANVIMLTYIAIDIIYRRTKLGSQMLQKLVEQVANAIAYAPFVILAGFHSDRYDLIQFLMFNNFEYDRNYNYYDEDFALYVKSVE